MWRWLVIAALLAGLARAQETGIGAPDGAERTAHLIRHFDSYALPMGVFGHRAAMTETVEGRVIWQAFKLPDPDASTSSVMAGYRARLAALGFEPVFSCRSDKCGGFDFRFRAEILPPPAMLLDVRDFVQFSAMRMPRAEGGDRPEGAPVAPSYASILASRVRDTIYIQTVRVDPAAAPIDIEAAPDLASETEVEVLPGDQAALLAQLKADGHLRIDGLEFDRGGARISPSSLPKLDIVAGLLARDQALGVMIVGHSDNVGGLAANLALSERRAEAVREALISRGVPEGQLEARGVGFLAPLASNATAEGRAINRRVELVLRETQ